MSLEDQLSIRFRCTKCDGSGAVVKRISATGTGLSKFFDIQHNQFIAASCTHCGFTELYNPEVFEGKRQVGNILDILFER